MNRQKTQGERLYKAWDDLAKVEKAGSYVKPSHAERDAIVGLMDAVHWFIVSAVREGNGR